MDDHLRHCIWTSDRPGTPSLALGRAEEPINSPTWLRRLVPNSPRPDEVDYDDSEDEDYTESGQESLSSAEDSDQDEFIVTDDEVDHMYLPLDTFERIDLESHLPLIIVRVQFPETRVSRYLAPPPEICRTCGELVHMDDSFDNCNGDTENHFCMLCQMRLDDPKDFTLRNGFCNCRCRCAERAWLALEIRASVDDSDSESGQEIDVAIAIQEGQIDSP